MFGVSLLRKPHRYLTLFRCEDAKAKGVDNYDRDLEDVIDRLIVECDRKITRALNALPTRMLKPLLRFLLLRQKKLRSYQSRSKKSCTKLISLSMLLLDAFNKDRATLPQPHPNAPVLVPISVVAPDARTQELINEKLKKAEDLGEQGMVDEAQKVMEEAEALKKLAPRPEPVVDSAKYTAADVHIKLCVCDICGAFLSVYDSDRRLADHFGGKLHLGYMQIREKLADLQLNPLHQAVQGSLWADTQKQKSQSRYVSSLYAYMISEFALDLFLCRFLLVGVVACACPGWRFKGVPQDDAQLPIVRG
ncbi:hypothetical protein KSS87_011769, partial [Heliosperma pusillum]